MDPISTAKIEELIRELKKDYTIVIVTHEEDIAAYTQRTIYVRDGEIIEDKKR